MTIPRHPLGVLKTTIPLVTFEDSGPDSALHFLCHEGNPRKPRSAHHMHEGVRKVNWSLQPHVSEPIRIV